MNLRNTDYIVSIAAMVGGGFVCGGADLKAAEMVWFWNRHCPDAQQRENPLTVPMRCKDMSNLMPAFIVVAEHDPLRDDGHACARRLKTADVPVTFRPGLGLIHGFVRARAVCEAARAEHEAMTQWLRTTAR